MFWTRSGGGGYGGGFGGGRDRGGYGGGGGGYGGGGGGRGGYGGGGRGGGGDGFNSSYNDPFEKTEREKGEIDAIYGATENTGIDFSHYEDIPVETSGRDVPASVTTFEELNLPPAMASNIQRCKYTTPTPVQRYAIPIGIAGRDLMACAQVRRGRAHAAWRVGHRGRPSPRIAQCEPRKPVQYRQAASNAQLARAAWHFGGLAVQIGPGSGYFNHHSRSGPVWCNACGIIWNWACMPWHPLVCRGCMQQGCSKDVAFPCSPCACATRGRPAVCARSPQPAALHSGTRLCAWACMHACACCGHALLCTLPAPERWRRA